MNCAAQQCHAVTRIAVDVGRELPDKVTRVSNELVNADDACTVGTGKLHRSGGTRKLCVVEKVHQSPKIDQQTVTDKCLSPSLNSPNTYLIYCYCYKNMLVPEQYSNYSDSSCETNNACFVFLHMNIILMIKTTTI